MNDIKKICIILAGFIFCFLLFDFGVGKFFDWAIKRMPCEGERVAKSEYVINQVKSDLIVIGSSRAEAHYDCQVLKDSFPSFSVFNCGVDGQLFYYIATSLNCIMDRYTPKVVIWDFQLKDLVDDTPENLSLLYPYYYNNFRVKEILDLQDPSLKYQLWINSYRYNGTASRILRAMDMKDSGNFGFLSHDSADKSRKIDCKDDVLKGQVLIPVKVRLLKTLILRAKKQGVKLIMCISPSFNRYVGSSATISCLQQLSAEYGVPFINDSQMKLFLAKDELWYDTGHLNAKGARIFTKELIKQIK